ncbi:DUF4230 domain-containing protein [Aquimarina sp. U1-2]|uniref:DUF4230 domain-containing protein n=1 Tax=Aquimarina sp. U1-2 TaxID=2823141 RepID=UPI001AECA738|nr:DUF4230 domain-containing protein [Aquimarina sp. U1-2]MBP2831559.1 DUF4230 domain-containing protein [Aquimarina sp. U1-2]
MRNFLLGATLMALLAFAIKYFIDQSNVQKTELQSSDLILDQIKNVGKLIVTEGHFAEVISYKDNKEFMSGLFTAKKTALVVVNAKVQIAYDLNAIEYTLDQETKTLAIHKIPKPNIEINPDIEYHTITADLFNQFVPKDHNTIRKKVTQHLKEKVKNSTLLTNSENRLISELQKLYILTNSLGWTLTYDDTSIQNRQMLQNLVF